MQCVCTLIYNHNQEKSIFIPSFVQLSNGAMENGTHTKKKTMRCHNYCMTWTLEYKYVQISWRKSSIYFFIFQFRRPTHTDMLKYQPGNNFSAWQSGLVVSLSHITFEWMFQSETFVGVAPIQELLQPSCIMVASPSDSSVSAVGLLNSVCGPDARKVRLLDFSS